MNINYQEVSNDAVSRLKLTTNLRDLSTADIIIEAIVESEDVKKNVFRQVDEIANKSCILASNTSSISITRLASATTRPHQVINPSFIFRYYTICLCRNSIYTYYSLASII